LVLHSEDDGLAANLAAVTDVTTTDRVDMNVLRDGLHYSPNKAALVGMETPASMRTFLPGAKSRPLITPLESPDNSDNHHRHLVGRKTGKNIFPTKFLICVSRVRARLDSYRFRKRVLFKFSRTFPARDLHPNQTG